MPPGSLTVDALPVSLGQRRGISDLARIALDLTWAPKRAEFDDSARSRAYPSPPMSGSPPLPPNPFQEAGGRGQAPGSYPPVNSQDAYNRTPSHQSPINPRGPTNMPPPASRLYQQEQPPNMPYSYHRHEEAIAGPSSYHQLGLPSMTQQQGYLPASTGSSTQAHYPAPGRQALSEPHQMTSPKSQRKTKGHVASACVPCKRAHLRCDAQRPCSRCVTNGKEEACIDVQHKKRGRPRLREDPRQGEARYDQQRYSQPQDASGQRPLSIYPSSSGMGQGYIDLNLSEGSEQMQPRYLERAPTTDPNMYSSHSPVSGRTPEPVAFLNMQLEFAKVSPVFAEALGGASMEGRNLIDTLVSTERDKVLAIRSQLLEEQTRKEPNYLPPILGGIDRVMQSLGFSVEDITRFLLDRQEYLTFRTYDGQVRSFPVRFGLAKEASIYFVVLVLNLPTRHPGYPPAPSPLSRDVVSGYSAPPPPPHAHHPSYDPRTAVSGPFDPARQRYNEGHMASRPPAPGIGPGGASYAASPSRQEYPGPQSYHIPRSELTAPIQPRPQSAFQLPPIRSQPERGEHSGEQNWSREERPGRVDIGGLIERPDAPGRPR
ncbi:hypothetical protein BGZ63DRAFT_441981 [Mariannaea sp. PMI_226]|nr:hypothetical protein BGZ63DRAFT_441981 [Mariannaea sp. PMI_226]